MRAFFCISVMVFLSGCGVLPGDDDQNLSVGNVQREIHIGMSGAAVAEALGSPNIVTTDEDRNETWIYDKISTRVTESETRGATGSIRFLEVWGPIAATSRSNRTTSSQRTLTVIIKFDAYDQVRDFAYHTSRF